MTVGPARDKADNNAARQRAVVANGIPGAKSMKARTQVHQQAGYTTATDLRAPIRCPLHLSLREESIYALLGVMLAQLLPGDGRGYETLRQQRHKLISMQSIAESASPPIRL